MWCILVFVFLSLFTLLYRRKIFGIALIMGGCFSFCRKKKENNEDPNNSGSQDNNTKYRNDQFLPKRKKLENQKSISNFGNTNNAGPSTSAETTNVSELISFDDEPTNTKMKHNEKNAYPSRASHLNDQSLDKKGSNQKMINTSLHNRAFYNDTIESTPNKYEAQQQKAAKQKTVKHMQVQNQVSKNIQTNDDELNNSFKHNFSTQNTLLKEKQDISNFGNINTVNTTTSATTMAITNTDAKLVKTKLNQLEVKRIPVQSAKSQICEFIEGDKTNNNDFKYFYNKSDALTQQVEENAVITVSSYQVKRGNLIAEQKAVLIDQDQNLPPPITRNKKPIYKASSFQNTHLDDSMLTELNSTKDDFSTASVKHETIISTLMTTNNKAETLPGREILSGRKRSIEQIDILNIEGQTKVEDIKHSQKKFKEDKESIDLSQNSLQINVASTLNEKIIKALNEIFEKAKPFSDKIKNFNEIENFNKYYFIKESLRRLVDKLDDMYEDPDEDPIVSDERKKVYLFIFSLFKELDEKVSENKEKRKKGIEKKK